MYKQICPKTIPACFKVSGVYCISFGEHSYIGSSKNVQQRISQHRKKLRAGTHQLKFMAYYCIFGEDKMYISLLEECDASQLKSREKYWIDTLEPDINREGIFDTKFTIQLIIGFIRMQRKLLRIWEYLRGLLENCVKERIIMNGCMSTIVRV